jgi:hypothetical protein
MNPALAVLEFYTPVFIKRMMLRDLFDISAQAFLSPRPRLDGLSWARMLETYAEFTRDEAKKALAGGQDVEAVKARLYELASALGTKLRRVFRVRGVREVMRLSRALYGILGIAFEGEPGGEVRIASCFFSQYYTGRVCWIISSLDEGVAAGLSGGGKLDFSERITEGGDCCRARLVVRSD